MSKATEIIQDVFKDVASAEPNSSMQRTLFQMSAAYEAVKKHLTSYILCEEQTAMIIDEAKGYVVGPMRVRNFVASCIIEC